METLKPPLQEGPLPVWTGVLVETPAPTRLGILDEKEALVGQIGVAEGGGWRDLRQRSGHDASGETLPLGEVEELEEAAVNERIGDALEACFGVSLHAVQVPCDTANGEVLGGT